MVTPTLSVVSVARIPSLEAACVAYAEMAAALWDDAADAVDALSPTASGVDGGLLAPALTRYAIFSDYELNTDWPALVLLGSPLKREPGQSENPTAGTWRGTLEFQYWAMHEDAQTLVRLLHRAQAVLWLLLISAERQRALGGVSLDPASMAVGTFPPPGGSLNVQAAVLACDVFLRA